jgi:putative aldouronate transport system permease protein
MAMSRLMDEKRIWSGYLNSFFYLFAGTTINLFLTIPAAYALSRKDFVGRNFFILIVTITMFFSGGLIPLYLVVKGLGILNTRWAMILPQAVIAWNLIVTRTFFQASIPEELLDASRIDGCSNTQFLFA